MNDELRQDGPDHGGLGASRWAIGGVLVAYFIAALEIVIMISPFAGFFYAAFNPLLLGLSESPATRWLTAFYLPHMIAPNTPLLLAVRVLGSVLFVGGALAFLVCAAQVYLGKLLRWGIAERGAYAAVRHPQYTSLAATGLGLAILWPRFLTLMALAVMLFLYHLLARDEERRMLRRYGDGYQDYLRRTGMYVPRLGRREGPPGPMPAPVAVGLPAGLLAAAAVFGFGLRAYTVGHLPLQAVNGVDVLTILPADRPVAGELVQAALADPRVTAALCAPAPGQRTLAYVMPIQYVMQGMIADTGPEWRLFHRHQTLSMIVDYVLHPIGHLQGGHMHHMAGMQHGPQMYASPMMQRRIIFVTVAAGHPLASPADDFAINAERRPRCYADVHLHTDEVMDVRATPPGTGWGRVPTPMF